MDRMQFRVDEEQCLQQYEREHALVRYVDCTWDFNTSARFMVANSLLFGIWVEMRCAGMRWENVNVFMGMMVLPMV
jgi:hypothetical protein